MKYHRYPRKVNYYETDAMGVLHHTNHPRYFEEARVEWLKSRGVMHLHAPHGDLTFAVLKMSSRYFKPAGFDEELEIWTQSRLEGLRIHFQYAVLNVKTGQFIADGTTELVPLSKDFRPAKIPKALLETYRQEPWDEAWPPPDLASQK